MSADIQIDVSQAMKAIDPDKMEKALITALTGAADLVRTDARTYPPVPPGSSYVRTGTLGRSWALRVGGLEAVIGNPTGYAPYVQGATEQAWMHKGRWRTTADIARKMTDPVRKLIEAALLKWAS